jgi:hypothetical protein
MTQPEGKGRLHLYNHILWAPWPSSKTPVRPERVIDIVSPRKKSMENN